jgi:hypothetical protein
MLTFFKRAWVPLVVVVAVVLGGVAVSRLRGVFGSDAIFTATGSSAEPLEPSHLKRVTYEIYGPSDTTGSVSYLAEKAQPTQVNFTSLPWTFTIASVVAQGNSDTIGCRIIVNGEVKDERSSAGHHAQTSCLVKAA